jgi:broad specificity phosphatase PhoE
MKLWMMAFVTVLGALHGASFTHAQQVVYLMRHAEQGPPPELALTEAGHRRAAALAHRLKDARITAIFATDAVRTQETAGPIAKAFGLTPKLVALAQIEELVQRVRSEPAHARVLVVNHSLNIGAILKGFGHRETAVVARDEYDALFIIVPRPDGAPLVLLLRL